MPYFTASAGRWGSIVSNMSPRQPQLLLERVTHHNTRISRGLILVGNGSRACILTFYLLCQIKSVLNSRLQVCDHLTTEGPVRYAIPKKACMASSRSLDSIPLNSAAHVPWRVQDAFG